MKHKCVFWTNTEDELPGGSVQANTLDYTIEDNDKQAWELAQNRQAKNSKTVYPKGAVGLLQTSLSARPYHLCVVVLAARSSAVTATQ